MAEHTPGPWEGCQGATCDCGTVYGADGATVAFVVSHRRKAEVDCWPSAETFRANYRLIAASPDMLEALQRVPATLERVQSYMRQSGLKLDSLDDPMQKLAFSIYSDLCQLDQYARAAIAKAEGKEEHHD